MSLRTTLTAASAFAGVMLMVTSAQGGQVPSTPPAPSGEADAELVAARGIYKIKNVDVDLTVPESPAFTALGLNPETIVRPATPREFATALLNGVDQSGHLQTGVAFDTVPYLVFGGTGLTLADYRKNRVAQILSRTSLSFATTKGAADDDKSVKLAYGVQASLYDSEDPRLNNDALLRCFAAIRLFKLDDLNTDVEAQRAAFERDVLQPRAAACREDFRRKARWNRTSWIVAFAGTAVSSTGLGKDLAGGARTFWTSWSYGFDGVPGLQNRAQLVGHVRHAANETVVDEDLAGGKEIRDTSVVGAQFRGGSSAFALSIEAAYLRTSGAGRPNDSAMRFAFSAERRLAQDVWMTLSFGGDRGAGDAANKGLSVLSALKWGFAKDPALVAARP